MVKKLFALASISALTGLVSAAGVAGCSSDTTTTPGDDKSKDGGSTPRREAGGPVGDDDDDDDDDDVKACYSDDPIDTSKVEYKPPRIALNACKEDSAAVMKTISDFVSSNEEATFKDLRDELEAKHDKACADCIFAPEGDTWAPIVFDGEKGFINQGGCVEIVSGKESCGHAYTKWSLCIDTACKDCSDQAEAKECSQEVQLTACKDAADELFAECGNNVQAFLNACPIQGAIKAQCAEGFAKPDSGTVDSGKDAD